MLTYKELTYPEPLWMDRPPNELFSVNPLSLKFPVEMYPISMDPISCSFQLSNKSDKHVSFRVKTTNPFKYSVQPKSCILLPRSQINVTVTMRALKGFSDVSLDEFLVQCIAVPPGTTLEKITPEMFNKEAESHVEECILVAAFTYNYVKPVEETSEDHIADSSGSFDHEITSPKMESAEKQSTPHIPNDATTHQDATNAQDTPSIKRPQSTEQAAPEILLKRGPRRFNGGLGPRRYNGGGGMSIHYFLLIAVLGFLLGYYVNDFLQTSHNYVCLF